MKPISVYPWRVNLLKILLVGTMPAIPGLVHVFKFRRDLMAAATYDVSSRCDALSLPSSGSTSAGVLIGRACSIPYVFGIFWVYVS